MELLLVVVIISLVAMFNAMGKIDNMNKEVKENEDKEK